MVADSHIHLYPPLVNEGPTEWAKQRGEAYWLGCVRPLGKRSIQGWATVDELLLDMDNAEVAKVAILGWYWENHDTCEENLNWLIEWTKAYPDRLIGFAPFNAKGGQRALDLLQLAFDVGLRGIGELNPPVQGYAYDDPILAKALHLANQAQAIVNFHVTDPEAKDHPGKVETPYHELLKLAADHPNNRFVFAHLGGLEPLRRTEALPDNVWYDTAAFPLLYKKAVYREFCDTVGPSRILFGTDYPLRVFPKSEASPDFAQPLSHIRNSDLSDTELGQIIGANFLELLGES